MPECGQWGTIEEFHEARPSASSRTAAPGRTSRTLSHAVPDSAAKLITEISTETFPESTLGSRNSNRVLGGGTVPGSVTLIAGEPGIGNQRRRWRPQAMLGLSASTARTQHGALFFR